MRFMVIETISDVTYTRGQSAVREIIEREALLAIRYRLEIDTSVAVQSRITSEVFDENLLRWNEIHRVPGECLAHDKNAYGESPEAFEDDLEKLREVTRGILYAGPPRE